MNMQKQVASWIAWQLRDTMDARKHFLFMHNSPENIYYRWRVYSFTQGDNFRYWRTEPFQITQGDGPVSVQVENSQHRTACQLSLRLVPQVSPSTPCWKM